MVHSFQPFMVNWFFPRLTKEELGESVMAMHVLLHYFCNIGQSHQKEHGMTGMSSIENALKVIV